MLSQCYTDSITKNYPKYLHGRIPTEQLAEEKQEYSRFYLPSSVRMLYRDHRPIIKKKNIEVGLQSQGFCVQKNAYNIFSARLFTKLNST